MAAWVLPGVGACQETPPAWRAGVVAEHSRLSNGYAPWNEAGVRLTRQQGRETADLGLVRTRRFDLEDTQVQAAYAAPLGPRVAASADLAYSATHKVLPRSVVGGQLQYEFAPAWLIHGGLRLSRYNATDVTQGRIMLEHYFGDFSAAAAWSPVRALGTRSQAYELRGSWFYRDDGSLTLMAGRGGEAATVAGGTVALARVRSVSLIARQRLSGPWSLTAAALRLHQGNFYTRTGASLGVQREF